jgi:regulatory protein
MPRITALEPEPRSGGVRIRVDGTPFATIAARDVVELGLQEGLVLEEAATAALSARADAFGARTVALRMLSARALPARELVRRLQRKGHAPEAAEAAIASLAGSGLLDDAEFARHYARTRVRQKRVGPGRLVADLRRLGVEERTARLAVDEALAADGVSTTDLLRDTAARKLRSLEGLPPADVRRRLGAFLRRRGFAAAEVIAVVKEAVKH